MDRKLLKILRKLESGAGPQKVVPATDEEHELWKYLMAQRLVDGVTHSEADVGTWYQDVKITFLGREYLGHLKEMYPSQWESAFASTYMLFTLVSALVITTIAYFVDWSNILS